MTHFSIAECMKKLNIQEGAHLDKMKELYCQLDNLILNEREYLSNCISQDIYTQVAEIDRDVWRGILLRSIKMGMESELGGAIKRECDVVDNQLSNANSQNTGVSGIIKWAACPEFEFSFTTLHTLTSEQKRQIYQAFDEGRISCYNVMGKALNNMQDIRRQLDFECDLMDLDRISVKASSGYFQGVKMNLKMALNDDNMAEKLEDEWLFYQKMVPSQRIKDFNRFVEDIRQANGLAPWSIGRHNEGSRGDNQNQR